MSRLAASADRVSQRPNHYETLGVSPTASWDEIVQAFAREGSVFRPQAFGRLAELCIAYETLRDPVRRRAYDASIGLKREPSFPKFAAGARQALVAKRPVKVEPVDQPAAKELPPPEPEAKPALPLGPAMDLQARTEPRISLAVSPSLSLEKELGVEARPIDWRRTGTVLGGVVVAACVLGGLAGWWSSGAIGETPQSGNVVSLQLPPAKPVADTAPEIAAPPVPAVTEARPARLNSTTIATPIERESPVAELPAAEEPTQEIQAEPSVGQQAADEAPTTSPVAAAMPLPNRTIARTIERIGYSCGSVASTAPVEGEAAGVFKVTCSSGQAYQARPVNGRYRFKRWGRR